MTVAPGTRLGVYEITAQIGEGGMGQVYRATDTKLKRQVAIKILPPALASDHDRLARFQREAEVLASLNHLNIAHIHGLEESSGVSALVMELVEGEDLSQRIARGPIPLDEALPMARQIAEALEAAHAQGIIHRDLKPANIKVRDDGTVKVLDFGLAKAMEPAAGSSPNVTQSPTITTPAMTQVGMILGTAAYMSPEQAKGRTADKRSDLWAFGCVLFEMLTGRRAFEGEDVSDTLANILKSQPDWQALPAALPQHVQLLVRRCLDKDRNTRVADASIARFLIVEPISTPGVVATRSSSLWRTVAPIASVAVAAAAIAGATAWWYAPRSAKPAVGRFLVYPPAKNGFLTAGRATAAPAISPDGGKLVFVARDEAGRVMLWIRPLDTLIAQPLSGTDDAAHPFWSPDSRFVAYFAEGRLMKIAASGGGRPETVCQTDSDTIDRGGSWSASGTIVFSNGLGRPLSRVSSAGGELSELMPPTDGQTGYSFPSFLPGGHAFLFYVTGSDAGVYVGSLDAGNTKRLVAADTTAVYDSQSGNLLFQRAGTLLAQPFDLETLALKGDSFQVAESLPYSSRGAAFSVSDNGILAYGLGIASAEVVELGWYDRQGKLIETVGVPGNYRGLDLAVDDQRVALHRHDGNGGDIWVMDLSRNTTTRLTFDASQENASPIWSADGTRLVYASTRNAKSGLYQKLANNEGSEERLIELNGMGYPVSWSPDRLSVVYGVGESIAERDLWVLPLAGDRKPWALLHSRFVESHGQLSPNGNWLAYYSTETGRSQVYVQRFPTGAGRWPISTNGGQFPRWRRDGRELFYMSQSTGGKMVAVDVKTSGATLEVGAPKELFDSPYVNLPHGGGPGGLLGGPYHTYAVSADGQRFLIPHPPSSVDATSLTQPIVIVMNWAAGIH